MMPRMTRTSLSERPARLEDWSENDADVRRQRMVVLDEIGNAVRPFPMSKIVNLGEENKKLPFVTVLFGVMILTPSIAYLRQA